jgi:hypothetical protein
MCSAKQHSSTNCHKDVATDGVREATQSHASESPVPGEGRSPNGPARRRRFTRVRETKRECRSGVP